MLDFLGMFMFLFTGFYAAASVDAMERQQDWWKVKLLRQGSLVDSVIERLSQDHEFRRKVCRVIHYVVAFLVLKGVVLAPAGSWLFHGHVPLDLRVIIVGSIGVGIVAYVLVRYTIAVRQYRP